ncbi:MAG: ABC-type uncharacterized transport system permease subunit [Flavobacteriales bacterium]|jgi:ABC-type uncharacterized transport system permease subunit
MIASIPVILYCGIWGLLLWSAVTRKNIPNAAHYVGLAVAIASHAGVAFNLIHTEQGYNFALAPISSAIFALINIVVFISGLKKPIKNLFLLLLPLSILTLIASILFRDSHPNYIEVNTATGIHIILSVLAYSLLTIATLQALLIDYQARRLKTHHIKTIMGVFPPLQTMETLLFELLWVGFLLLSTAILTGLVFIEDLLAQKLSHKLVFSLLSWLIYAILLGGRQLKGWRGNRATRWVLAGFLMLMLAYYGSKFVIEVLLS